MGQEKDYSLGDKISDNSKVLIPKRQEEKSVLHMVLLKGVSARKHISWQKVVASDRGADVSINDFSAFLHMRRCKKLSSKSIFLKIPI